MDGSTTMFRKEGEVKEQGSTQAKMKIPRNTPINQITKTIISDKKKNKIRKLILFKSQEISVISIHIQRQMQ